MKSIDYLKWFKKQNFKCLICFQDAEIHHVNLLGMGADRTKENDKHFEVVALCRKHHQEIHKLGISAFQEYYEIDLWGEVGNYLIKYIKEN